MIYRLCVICYMLHHHCVLLDLHSSFYCTVHAFSTYFELFVFAVLYLVRVISIVVYLCISAHAKNIWFRQFYHAANFPPVSQSIFHCRCSTYNFERYSSSSSSSSSSTSGSADKTVSSASKSAQASSDATASAPATLAGDAGKTETAKPGISKPPKDAVSEIVVKGVVLI